ncbi:MAG: hypothetical protein RLZZ58_1434 [Pseudomonadota bacterium]
MNPIFYRLSVIHHRLEREIAQERGRLRPDGLRLQRLKKLKLAIKDRLTVFMRRGAAPALS